MTFPSLFSLSRGLFSCPRHWSFLPLNLVNLAGPALPSNVLSVCLSLQDWEVLVLEKLKWDLVSVIANDFLAHILHHLPLPNDKMELVKKHAQTFIALCATGGCLLSPEPPTACRGGWLPTGLQSGLLGNLGLLSTSRALWGTRCPHSHQSGLLLGHVFCP